MKESVYSLPIHFTVNNEISNNDDRFLSVTIDVLHTGLNFNGSVFNKNVVDENVETIKNTPILGFVRVLPDGEKDFKGHEYILTRTENGIERKYIGSAYGLIPETCNPRWITKMCDDGAEREFLQVDGLLWTKFSDSIDIMMRDIEKPHSMELFSDNIEGYENEDGIFIFEKFSFDGCCILGSTDDIQPAMINSNIRINEVQFTMSDFVKNLQNELSDKLNTFTRLVNEKDFTELVNEKTNQEGGIGNMSNTDFTQTVLEQFSDISNMVREYETTVDAWGYEVPRFYLADIQDNEVIVVDRKDNYHYYGFSFIVDGDKPEIDFTSGNRKKIRYENYEEGTAISESAFDFGKHITEIEETAFTKVSEAETKVSEAEQAKIEAETNYTQTKTDYETIKADYDEIKPKYDEYVLAEEKRLSDELNAQKDAKFAEFENVLAENADFAVLKERKAEMSLDEIESECSILYARATLSKGNFSKTSNTSAVVGVMHDTGSTEGYVKTKYGFIPVSDKK